MNHIIQNYEHQLVQNEYLFELRRFLKKPSGKITNENTIATRYSLLRDLHPK